MYMRSVSPGRNVVRPRGLRSPPADTETTAQTPKRALPLAIDQANQIADGAMSLNWMPQVLVGQDAIVILPSDLLALDNATLFQIGNDPLYGSFSDADMNGDLSQDHRGMT